MSLEAVVFQHLQESRNTTTRRRQEDEEKIHSLPYVLPIHHDLCDEDVHAGTTLVSSVSSSSSNRTQDQSSTTVCSTRRKRRRSMWEQVDEGEVERQRRKHIQVERNRRKQMNDYLAIIRSLMPPSYSLRGDQASIVGGAITFVKELEQLLQHHQSHHNTIKLHPQTTTPSALFAGFFSFPQYSTTTTTTAIHGGDAVADVEVVAVERQVLVKVLSRKRPKQLLTMLLELASAHFTVLHLNVTSIDKYVLYSFSLKKEDECQLNTVNEVATVVYDMIRRIQHHEVGNS